MECLCAIVKTTIQWDLDIFIGNNINDSSMPDCYLLNNNKGVKVETKLFLRGMVTDAVFTDFNKDGKI
jgi:hypothetical protein